MPMWGGNSLPPVLVEIPKLMFLCSQSDQRARFRVPRRTHEELAKFPPCWLTFRNLTFRIVFWSYVEMRDCNRKTFPLVAVTCSGGLWVFHVERLHRAGLVGPKLGIADFAGAESDAAPAQHSAASGSAPHPWSLVDAEGETAWKVWTRLKAGFD